MSVLTTWTYPLWGIFYMTSTPQLWRQVLKFLGTVAALSLVSLIVWFRLVYGWHLNLFAHVFGIGFFNKFVTTVVVLLESAAPIYVIFDKQMERLQKKLFKATMEVRGTSVTKADCADLQYITAQIQKQREAEKVYNAKTSLPSKTGWKLAKFAIKIFMPDAIKESALMKITRATLTLPLKITVPFLLPVFAYLEGYADSTHLLSQYWAAKGLASPEAQEVVAAHHSFDYRAFGAVASMLNYIPVLNWFLGLSNSVGAALWAAQMEKRRGRLFAK